SAGGRYRKRQADDCEQKNPGFFHGQPPPEKKAGSKPGRSYAGSARAARTKFFVISFRQRNEKSVLSMGREGPAAAAAASAIEASFRARPVSAGSHAERRIGAEATPPRTRRAAVTVGPSRQTAAPTDRTGK